VTAAADRIVRFVVPQGIGEAAGVSGGNIYDLRVREGLVGLGWEVSLIEVDPDAAAPALADAPDYALVLVDGLVAGRSPEALAAEAERLRLVVIAHMVSASFPGTHPRTVEDEQRALAAARVVVTTSDWTRSELIRAGVVDAARIVVATPGTDVAPAARGTTDGDALLCVGVVAPHKGQDVLVEALAALEPNRDWTCTIAGSLHSRPRFARRIADRAREAGLGGQVMLPGVLGGPDLDHAYRGTDLLVAPSRVESYGMAIAEALGHGIPVLASDVGGVREAVGDGEAAILVPPGDVSALVDALTRWMSDSELRSRMTDAAHDRRDELPRWSETAQRVADALEEAR
jgi:glycosyltransferase involved in cell wall biosynthesis